MKNFHYQSQGLSFGTVESINIPIDLFGHFTLQRNKMPDIIKIKEIQKVKYFY